MMSWIKRLAVPIAAIALVGMVSTVNADTVTFHTTGSFNGGSNVLTVPGTGTPGDMTITFNGATAVPIELLPDGSGNLGISASYGSFSLSDTVALGSMDLQSLNGTTFTLTVVQDDPDPFSGGSNNSHALSATLTGTIVATTGGATGANQIKVVFNSSDVSFFIPGDGLAYPPTLRYQVDRETVILSTNDVHYPGTIGGTVSAAPLPGVAVAGMGLLGGVGGLNWLRRRSMLAA